MRALSSGSCSGVPPELAVIRLITYRAAIACRKPAIQEHKSNGAKLSCRPHQIFHDMILITYVARINIDLCGAEKLKRLPQLPYRRGHVLKVEGRDGPFCMFLCSHHRRLVRYEAARLSRGVACGRSY